MVATEWAYLLVGEAFLCGESECPVWPFVYLNPYLMCVLVVPEQMSVRYSM